MYVQLCSANFAGVLAGALRSWNAGLAILSNANGH